MTCKGVEVVCTLDFNSTKKNNCIIEDLQDDHPALKNERQEKNTKFKPPHDTKWKLLTERNKQHSPPCLLGLSVIHIQFSVFQFKWRRLFSRKSHSVFSWCLTRLNDSPEKRCCVRRHRRTHTTCQSVSESVFQRNARNTPWIQRRFCRTEQRSAHCW